MTAPEPTVRATRYEVSCLPKSHPAHRHLMLRVEERNEDRWVVCQPGMASLCAAADGSWAWESGVTDEWIAKYRHDFETAMEIARREARTLTVNGRTVADVLARTQEIS